MEMLGAITGLIGAGLQAKAQADQLQYEYAALNFQKQRADKQDWMAGAARTDQYGNVTKYDPVLNAWTVTYLAPTQKGNLELVRKSNSYNLRKTLPLRVRIEQAVQERAQQAKAPFHTAALGYQYDQPKAKKLYVAS